MDSQDPQNLLSLDELKIKEDKIQGPAEESKTNPSSSSIIENTPSKLLAWCSWQNNKISIMDLETKQEYTKFDGAKISDTEYGWTHMKEIPNTNLLVSLHHDWRKAANLEIFDISKKGQAKKIYSLEDVTGVVGQGDATYNVRRNIMGAISLEKKVSYHLFSIDANASKVNETINLHRKSKWYPHYSDKEENSIIGLDFNPMGEKIATIDEHGVCLISDVNTASYIFHLDLEMSHHGDGTGRCRWSSNAGEPLLYIKYDRSKLNILDAEKKELTLMNPFQLDQNSTFWIDVCQSNGNLLASGGKDKMIKIFDKRESKLVKTFDNIHSGWIRCVKWNPSGDMLASASNDKTVKLLDFKTGKIIHTGKVADGNWAMSVCFI